MTRVRFSPVAGNRGPMGVQMTFHTGARAPHSVGIYRHYGGVSDIRVTAAQGLTWRLRRQGLTPTDQSGVDDVLDRVLTTRAWPPALAQATVDVRQASPTPGSLAAALEEGSVICSYALRGGSYLLTPATGAALLTTHTVTESWSNPRFQRQAGFTLDDWQPLREAMAQILADGPKTRRQISEALSTRPALRHLADAALGAGADTLYKPLHWWGDICFGPSGEGEMTTFRRLASDTGWPGSPQVDDAGREVIRGYLRAYAPASRQNLHYWLAEGLGVPRKRVDQWLADLSGEIAQVTFAGVPSYVWQPDLEDLLETGEVLSTLLIPGYDPWVMGPGSADEALVASQRRSVVTRGANLVISTGRVAGTWKTTGSQVAVTWFAEAGPAPESELRDHVARRMADSATEPTLAIAIDSTPS